jgi:Peptidase family M23
MNALGGTLIGIQSGFLLLAGIFVGGSIGGFLGSGYKIVAAIFVILLWGAFAGCMINSVRLAYAFGNGNGDLGQALTWANWLFIIGIPLSALTGLGFAFLSFVGCGPLYLPRLYHYGGMAATILSLAAFFMLPLIVHWCGENNSYPGYHTWAWVVFVPLGVAIFWGVVWMVAYFGFLKGDITLSDYGAANHIYKLPFPGGEDSWVIQGNNSNLDHNDSHFLQKFSWDFERRCGTPVLASRDGTISEVIEINDSYGTDATNNQITVNQADGTVAFYLHIQKGSVPAKFSKTGTVVHQGDEIALAGCVGRSLTGHIHFMVRKGSPSIGVSFVDVTDDNGIPRTFGTYTSGNKKVP